MPELSPIAASVVHHVRLRLFFIALIASGGALAASKKTVEAEQILQEAIARNDIRELPSFEMKASVKLDNHGHPIEGSYSLFWNGQDQWREEINIPGYSEIKVADKNAILVKRTTEYLPWQINVIHGLLDYAQYLAVAPNEKIKRVLNREISGIKAACVEIAFQSSGSRQVCIDPSNGALVRELPFVDENLTSVGTKVFPFSLSYLDHGKLIAEATVTELKTPAQFSASKFDPLAGGVSQPKCDSKKVRAGKLIARVNPVYPVAQRYAHVEGTVKLYAVIGTDGIPHNLEVLSSVDPALDASSLEAVQQWRYEPYTCNGIPVEVESVVQVNYSLAH